MHLQAVHDMLNLFAATGHNNYAKSSRLYLQMMCNLETSHPWLYEMFATHGFHSVCRSNRFWAGLSTDLLIEQIMMRTIKGRGGLTRGRGFDESVRSVWVHTLHQCASIHLSMTTLTGLQTGAQEHGDIGFSRSKRDCSDLKKILDWLVFPDNRLRSLSSGLTATDDDKVTCYDAEYVGSLIHGNWDGVGIRDASARKAGQVKTLAHLQKVSPDCIILMRVVYSIDLSSL